MRERERWNLRKPKSAKFMKLWNARKPKSKLRRSGWRLSVVQV